MRDQHPVEQHQLAQRRERGPCGEHLYPTRTAVKKRERIERRIDAAAALLSVFALDGVCVPVRPLKAFSLALGFLAAAGCGGTWSNDDLVFLNALPSKAQLTAKLPGADKTTTPLVGEGTRRDGLGQESKLYTDTKNASNTFNGILTFVVDVLEAIGAHPPTARAKDVRVWGPWSDEGNPGFEAQATMVRVDDENFGFRIDFRPKGGAFFTVVEGAFKATRDLHQGRGVFVIHAGVAAEKLPNSKDLSHLEKIEVGYFTEGFPVTVNMVFTGAPAQALKTLSYGYQELETRDARIGFSLTGTDPNTTRVDTLSTWKASGAGFGVLTVVDGNYKGATQVDCWDDQFKVTFTRQTWPGGVLEGDERTCVAVDGFPR